MIATSGEEDCARITPHRLVEAESVVVELLGCCQITYVKVHVTDGRARGRAVPFPAFAGRNEAVDVQRLGGHDKLLAPVGPGRTGPVCIYLDSEPVRVAQVQRFAHGVVGHPGTQSQTEQMRRKTTERRSVGQEKGEVIQTESASSWHRRNIVSVDLQREPDAKHILVVHAALVSSSGRFPGRMWLLSLARQLK